MARVTGRDLNERWGVNAQHALYRVDGTWYHLLEKFPGALFDNRGYVLFETKEDLNYPGILLAKRPGSNWLNVPEGIASLPGYVSVQAGSWSAHSELPIEDAESAQIWEGAKQQALVNRYERDVRARAKCIEIHGTLCCVCKFDFVEKYGKIGQGFIHVHHLIPLSLITDRYKITSLSG